MSSFFSLPPRDRPERVKPPPRPPSPVSATPAPPLRSAKTRKSSASSISSDEDTFHDARFPPEEEAALLSESHTLKAAANTQFASAAYSDAISTYDKAIASCPNYLDFDIAVLQSNIAACHLKLEQWKDAIESANQALEGLDREDPPPRPKKTKKEKDATKKEKTGAKTTPVAAASDSDDSDEDKSSPANGAVVELPSDEDEESTTAALNKLNLSDERLTSINRIRTKSLLRRARARSSLAADLANPSFSTGPKSPNSEPKASSFSSSSLSSSRWSLLIASLEDYQTLSDSKKPYLALLPPSDLRTVHQALRTLPPLVEEAKQKETAEMMGKLKELGNGILKPFGLSTDMFKMVKDEGTGGYSLNFEQGKK